MKNVKTLTYIKFEHFSIVHTVEVKKGDVYILFCPVEMEVKRPFPYTTMGTGQTEGDAMERAVDYSNRS
jgi:hypothetical protein